MTHPESFSLQQSSIGQWCVTWQLQGNVRTSNKKLWNLRLMVHGLFAFFGFTIWWLPSILMDVLMRETGTTNKKVLCSAEFNKALSVVASACCQTVVSHYALHSIVIVSNLSVEVTKNYNNIALWCVAEDTFKLAIKWIFCRIITELLWCFKILSRIEQ